MRRTIVTFITALSLALVPASAVVSTAYAACPGATTAEGQILNGVGQTGSGCETSGFTDVIATVIEIFSYIIGVVAIFVVIYAGFKYITSGGESGKIGNAKNTLIYALVGLVIAALAQFLVHFVLNQAATATDKPCPAGQHRDADNKCVK